MIVHRWLLLVVTVAFIELSTANHTDSETCSDLRIKNGPVIYPCVSEIILQKGQNFTLTCKGNTKLQFKQQHISEEVTSGFKILNKSSQISAEGFSFERKLELYNIDQFAIGYYACADNTVNISDFITKITKDAINSEHVSFIYVYVNGTNELFAPMRELVISRSDMVLIECKPTTPDVKIQLYPPQPQNKTQKQRPIKAYSYSPKIGFMLKLKKCSFAFRCLEDSHGDKRIHEKKIRIDVVEPPTPNIIVDSIFFLKGETFSLNCTVSIEPNMITKLSWILPKENITFTEDTNSGIINEGILYSNITISDANEDHAGVYSCVSANSCEKRSKNITKKLTEPHLRLKLRSKSKEFMVKEQLTSSINFEVDAHPNASYKVLKNGQELLITPDKYTLIFTKFNNYLVFMIRHLEVTDTANYSVVADNGYINTIENFSIKVQVKPIINFGQGDKKCVPGTKTDIACDVLGYPLPIVSWVLTYDNSSHILNSWSVVSTSLYNTTAYLRLHSCTSGKIECRAKNSIGVSSASHNLRVYEMNKGFGINLTTTESNGTFYVNEDDNVTVICLASKYEYSNVSWIISGDKKLIVEYPKSTYSHVAELKIDKITVNHTGSYTCIGTKNGTMEYDNIQIIVLKLQTPVVQDVEDKVQYVHRFQDTELNCVAVGAPRPEIKWFKDGEPFSNSTNVNIFYDNLNVTTVNSTIVINNMQPENVGNYICEAKNNRASQIKSFELNLKVVEGNNKNYVIAIAVIILLLIILIVYLTMKIKKEKKFRKELAAAGLLYFKEGVTKSINPDLGIDEQAELLPYKEEFEFPAEKLMLGKQLGAGAFGVVYKAEARGIVNAEETTPVAVKMVKKTADNMYIKALASELKIMVHLGKHINIVNLLGACTKNVGKRELVVIVEYCRYGNIHNYMQRHREVFIDQLDTDNKEKLGKVNRAYTSSSCGSTGAHSDYFGSANTQNTDNTFLNTANTVHSTRKNIPNSNQPIKEVDETKASEGYVQPEWRSNYESDYSYDGRVPRPLSSRDLLAWSFQIARGMEYLASRKVLHGDLAARNILLADDNIVKICDFGLAKSIYKNDEYQKKENALLPWKWLAIECMTDRIFSTQSDVWSFGIVLWELFTLAKTPYPNMHPTSLLQFLTDGHRLDKPAYADERLYNVMKKCWEAKPTQRPTFSQLQLLLGTFLEDNVRNHYVDLNSAYVDKNAKGEGQEDYLAMVSAPDYNNMVTPSPHHYVNTDRNFFPTTPKVDEEGYLQISPSNQGIFSPRIPDTEFDFDPRKLNVKMSEASSCGSELTPMLTLNNLPTRSGSESDHEGNPPYLNACPRIDEETDEVFTPCLNDKNAKNIQQSAVTNPTYITFDNYDEKPKDIINYVNINVPNGLVK